MKKPQGAAKLALVMFVASGLTALGAGSADAALAAGNVPLFASGSAWEVCAGYSGTTHHDAEKLALDFGPVDCGSASGRAVRAPMAGTVASYDSVSKGLCVNVTDGRSYLLRNLTSTLTAGQVVTGGDAVGTIGAASTANDNHAWLHVQQWEGPGCAGTSIPLSTGAQICGAAAMATTNGPFGPDGRWSSYEFTAKDCKSFPMATKGGLGSNPVVVADGILFSFVHTAQGAVAYRTRDQASDLWDAQWTNLGTAPGGVTLTGTPSAIVSDGYLWVFALGSDGKIYSKKRDNSTDTWSSAWQTEVGAPAGKTMTGTPTAVVSDGLLWVFGVDSAGLMQFKTRKQGSSAWNASWSDIAQPGGTKTLGGSVSAIVNDGALWITGVAADGTLWYQNRGQVSNKWMKDGTSAGWTTLGKPGVPLQAGGAPSAVSSDGQMFVNVLGRDGSLYSISRGVQSNTWSESWTPLGNPGVQLQGSAVSVSQDSGMFVEAVGQDGKLYYVNRHDTSNTFDSWANRATPTGTTLVGTPATIASDNDLYVFGVGSNGALYNDALVRRTHVWKGWTSRTAPSASTVAPYAY